eukprot:3913400-Lingulodinium_polyedra.AAC.1
MTQARFQARPQGSHHRHRRHHRHHRHHRHQVHNMCESVRRACDLWDEFWGQSKNIEGLLRCRTLRKRYIAICVHGSSANFDE